MRKISGLQLNWTNVCLKLYLWASRYRPYKLFDMKILWEVDKYWECFLRTKKVGKHCVTLLDSSGSIWHWHSKLDSLACLKCPAEYLYIALLHFKVQSGLLSGHNIPKITIESYVREIPLKKRANNYSGAKHVRESNGYYSECLKSGGPKPGCKPVRISDNF